MHLNWKWICFGILFFNYCVALQVTETKLAFSSQTINTRLYLKIDNSGVSGVTLTASLSGPDAPDIRPEEVFEVNGGFIEVKPINLKPSIVLSVVISMLGLFYGPNLGKVFAGLTILSIGLSLSSSMALHQFNSDWSLDVIASVPPTYMLDSLDINILHGSIVSDPDFTLSTKLFNANLCGASGNTILLYGLALGDNATVCASDSANVQSTALGTDFDALSVTSLYGTATVLVHSSFSGSYKVVSSSNLVNASPCARPSFSEASSNTISGTCGSNDGHLFVSAYADAVLDTMENQAIPDDAKRWSDVNSWPSGEVPKDGQSVVIEEGVTILLDTSTAALGDLEVRGALLADNETDFWVIADSINVYGKLQIGTATNPYTRKGIFTLTGAKGTYPSRSPLLGFSNPGVSRGFRIHEGAQFKLFGKPPGTTYTRLNEHAKEGDTVLTVDSVKGWSVGDEIVISPTTLPATSNSDLRKIVAVDEANKRVTIGQGLSHARWGKFQYVTDNGISLTQGVFDKLRADPEVSDVLDERAVIIHLTRNIVIEGKNDTHWNQGHGVHVMWMGVSTNVQLNGVEVRRAGQAGAIGRYPLHAHMQSYNMPNGTTNPSDGNFLGDVNVYVRNCAVHASVNRAMVIHGTCGARYVNNVAYDILGHAYFFEDGSELRNNFIGNVVLNVRMPTNANKLLMTEYFVDNRGSSGIWLSNGNNYFRNNIAGDIRQGPGIWNSFARRPMPQYVDIVTPGGVTFAVQSRSGIDVEWKDRYAPKIESWELVFLGGSKWSVKGSLSGVQPNATTNTVYDNDIVRFKVTGTPSVGAKLTFRIDGYVGGCFGLSKNVDLIPYYTPTLDYSNNTAFACGAHGILTDFFVLDELGTTTSEKFTTMNDSRPGADFNNPRRIPTKFDRHRIWMNTLGAYSNRVFDPLYVRWICADNYGTDLRGATQVGELAQGLFIGFSLNNLDPIITTQGRHAFATYHFSISMHDILLMNYPPLPSRKAYVGRELLEMPGAIESWDLYLYSVETGATKLSNWKQFNVTQFERTPPPNIEQMYQYNAGGPHFDNRYWTLSGAVLDYQGILAGNPGDYIIFNHTFLTFGLTNARRVGTPESLTLATSNIFYGIQVTEADTNGADLDPVTFLRLNNSFTEVSRWVVEDGRKSVMFGNMRHASALKGGRYKVYNHNQTAPNADIYQLTIANANRDADEFIVSLPWSGSVDPIVYLGRNALDPNTRRPYNGDFALNWSKVLTSVASRSAMVSTRQSYWRDTANNEIWVHHKGGFSLSGPIYDQYLAITIRPAL